MKSFVGLVQSFDTTPAAAVPQSFGGCFLGLGSCDSCFWNFGICCRSLFRPPKPLLDQPKAGHDPPSSGGRTLSGRKRLFPSWMSPVRIRPWSVLGTPWPDGFTGRLRENTPPFSNPAGPAVPAPGLPLLRDSLRAAGIRPPGREAPVKGPARGGPVHWTPKV